MKRIKTQTLYLGVYAHLLDPRPGDGGIRISREQMDRQMRELGLGLWKSPYETIEMRWVRTAVRQTAQRLRWEQE